MAGQDNNGRTDTQRVLRPVLAALAACVIAFCGWSAWEYSRGADPLAFLGGDAFQTVSSDEGQQASSIELSGNGGEAQGDQPAEAIEERTGEKDEGAAGASSTDASSQEPAGGSASSDGSSSGGSGTGSTSGGSSASSSAPSTGGSPSSGTGSGGGASSPSASRPARITVSIAVDGSAAGAGASSATLSLEEGSTVYDALASCGVAFNAKSTGYGMYVSSIAGLAEKEHGDMSGWMYSVNGVTPNVACSSYELSDGDSVYWWYANVTE